MALEERFTYQVVPKKPIRNIVKGKIITRTTILSLSKSEVLQCLKCGNVYRKFYLDTLERVTPSNLDRLHMSDHISEEDYKNKKGTEEKTVSGLTYESSGTVNPQPEQHEEYVADEPKEDQPEEVEIKKAEEEQLSTDNDLVSADTEDVDDSENVEHEETNDNSDTVVNKTVPEANHESSSSSKSRKKKNKNKNNNTSETSSVPKTAN